MLSKQDNELLCRVGPGTPMGALMPVLDAGHALERASSPRRHAVRVRLLGEDLIAFRTTSGDIGMVQQKT